MHVLVYSILEFMNFQPISLNVIVCATESERAELERKGDLDRFERLDGDRNQTSKYLAVKKVSQP